MTLMTTDPLNSQVGGSHYKKYAIQPIEYAFKNKLDYCQANSVKYVTRFRDKNGLQDLRKAKHNIDLLILFEYGPEALLEEQENKGQSIDERTSLFHGV